MSALKFLTELDDVEGAFVVDDKGGLLAASMPAVYDHDYCSNMGGQALRLLESMAMEMPSITDIVMRMSLLSVLLRRLGSNLMVVLVQPGARMTSLRVAMNVVANKFDPVAEKEALYGPPPAAAAVSMPAAPPPAANRPIFPAPSASPEPEAAVKKVIVKKKKPSSSRGIWG